MGFNDVTAAVQAFSEDSEMFGESFTYTAPNGGATTSGLVGVCDEVVIDFQFDEFTTKKITVLTVVSSKTQWGAVVPGDRGVVTYNAITYQIERIGGLDTPAEPTYSLTCKKLT